MVTRKVVWLAPQKRDFSWPGRAGGLASGLGSAPRALLWLAGAGAVAFWVWQFQRRANAANAGADFPLLEQSSADGRDDPGAAAAAGVVRELPPPAATLPFRREPAPLPARSSPWVYRARVVLRQGGAAELRQLAAEMEHAGLEAEAGLLGNYALLLERTSASRPRVQAEVIRLLEAAAVERGVAPGEWQRPIVPMPIVPIETRRRAVG